MMIAIAATPTPIVSGLTKSFMGLSFAATGGVPERGAHVRRRDRQMG
jgi:hypothetical protein